MERMRRRSRWTSSAAVSALVLSFALRASAQEAEVDPAAPVPAVQFDYGLRGVASVNGQKSYGGANAVGTIDISDTYVYARARTPMFASGDRAGTMFAVTFPDQYYEPGSLLVAEANAFYEARWWSARLGRGRIASEVVPMPTLRDDDMIRFTDAQNPFTDGRSTADHQYGNVAEAAVWVTPRLFAQVHLENLSNFVLQPQALSSFELNSYGVTLGFREIPSLARMSVVRRVAIGMNAYHVALPAQDFIFDAVAGAWLNLVPDPVHTVDWRVQAIYDRGVPGLNIATLPDTFRVEQAMITSSLGYEYRREMLPTIRTNVIGAYKRYVKDGIGQMTVGANVFYALGASTEIGLQYQFRSRASIPEAFGDDFAHSVKLAFIVALDGTTTSIFSERTSLLNVESGHLP
jgi:hypothetical protein